MSTHHVNLTPQESSLIGESHPEALMRMDEKSLKDLQSRLRQAREKNFNLLPRHGAARVAAEGARGSAQQANEKRGEKLEIFDEALVRVNERLGAIGGNEWGSGHWQTACVTALSEDRRVSFEAHRPAGSGPLPPQP